MLGWTKSSRNFFKTLNFSNPLINVQISKTAFLFQDKISMINTVLKSDLWLPSSCHTHPDLDLSYPKFFSIILLFPMGSFFFALTSPSLVKTFIILHFNFVVIFLLVSLVPNITLSTLSSSVTPWRGALRHYQCIHSHANVKACF